MPAVRVAIRIPCIRTEQPRVQLCPARRTGNAPLGGGLVLVPTANKSLPMVNAISPQTWTDAMGAEHLQLFSHPPSLFRECDGIWVQTAMYAFLQQTSAKQPQLPPSPLLPPLLQLKTAEVL